MKLGLRNLMRRPGRTLGTCAMLFVGTMMIVFVVGMNEGTYADIIRMATGTWSGHGQVIHRDYHETPALHEALERPAQLVTTLEADPRVEAAAARLEVAGLLSAGTRTAGAQLIGVMAEAEARVSTLPRAVARGGSFLGAAPSGDEEALPIVLGAGLAQRLKVGLGQEVVYMGQAADGSIAAEAFEVVGVLSSGLSELDATLAMIRLSDAQALLEMPDRAHRVVVKLHDLSAVDALGASLELDEPARFYTWSELAPELERSIENDRAGGVGILLIIIVIIALGVVNTMVMSVFERTQELGVMKALGTSPGRLVAIVLWESFWLALVGVVLGAAAGAGLNVYFGAVGIEFFEEAVEFGGMEIQTIYPANMLVNVVAYPAVIFAAALLGGLWPAVRAARVDPVRAIREV